MQPAEFDDLLSFAGHSSKECEDFIIKVTKAAFHECFLRDDERVAALAAAGLEGKALQWYEALPITSAVRTDWQLLRQYMLDRWSADTDSEGEDPPPAYSAALTLIPPVTKTDAKSIPLLSPSNTPARRKEGRMAAMREWGKKLRSPVSPTSPSTSTVSVQLEFDD
ncbi:hypothetical protein M407DRAFT_23584 [Tulasnella calospora MUT 4182]|uniref:Retrotransposon gag domain-containing protein n=1 Tax=Tulasnella calospora MUT 4182 TaxID=1051891 RepID=A0A0C3L0H2_9AGAM|nr:hypothetical protein M407DRAFT_23584 [Tulasnella calospora MUT 4182]